MHSFLNSSKADSSSFVRWPRWPFNRVSGLAASAGGGPRWFCGTSSSMIGELIVWCQQGFIVLR